MLAGRINDYKEFTFFWSFIHPVAHTKQIATGKRPKKIPSQVYYRRPFTNAQLLLLVRGIGKIKRDVN